MVQMYLSPWEHIRFTFYSYYKLKCSIAKLFYQSQELKLPVQKLKGKNRSKYETWGYSSPCPHVRLCEGGGFQLKWNLCVMAALI